MSLVLHSPELRSGLTTFEALAAMPPPRVLGPYHKPVAHATLVEAFRLELTARGVTIDRETLAVSESGTSLFGVMDLRSDEDATWGRALGFRNSINMTMGIRAVAGLSVFVCDNLALSGDMFAISRKNTIGLDLSASVHEGFDRFLTQSTELAGQVTQMQELSLSDEAAKALIYDMFAKRAISMHLFDDVDRTYFAPAREPDVHPRTAWGVYNAFTRVLRDRTPMSRFTATVALSKAFHAAVAGRSEAA